MPPPMCLVDRFSVLRFLLLFFVFSGMGEVKGQNVINIYQDFTGQPAIEITNLAIFEYDGEYQIFPREFLHWDNLQGTWYPGDFSDNYTITRKIELVSFPFYPDFEASGNSQRIFRVLDDAIYNPANESWSDPNWNPILPNQVHKVSTAGEHTLVSDLFDQMDPISGQGGFLPHSVFNHTVYLECGVGTGDQTVRPEKVIDLVSFPIDVTIAKMREYPFTTSNDKPTAASEHDISILPFIDFSPGFDATTNNLNTINYFPQNEVTPTECEAASFYFYPNIGDAVNNNNTAPNQYIHPAPFSLVGFHLNNASGAYPAGYERGDNDLLEPVDGIKHQYFIDKNIDLTNINPEERIIYNPSEVHITADNLVFPSGYTFKTVRGLYPTVDEVANTTVCDAADDLEDQRLVHVETDLQNTVSFTTPEGFTLTAPAFYVLEPDSKLTIEPCVSLFDVTFYVRSGAELVFHPNQTYGNFQIVEEAADVTTDPEKVIEVNLPGRICNDCRCVQEYTIDEDLVIEDGETVVWVYDQTVRGQITIENGGELQILNCQVEFTDADANMADDVVFTGIKVEAGGKLKLHYADLTILNGDQPNNCAARHQSWNGIHLKGINPKAVGEHAVLDVTGGSISYAKNAIHAEGFVYDDFGESNWICGGKVSARNVTFTNNHVSYYAFNTNPINGFMGCTFEREAAHINRENNLSDESLSHVFLFNQRDLKFRNCVFRNNLSFLDPNAEINREFKFRTYFFTEKEA
ncbi:MAG: hypothetical protein R3E32_20110 [Chitinophagales bacterium]